jgi:hypothetical protein
MEVAAVGFLVALAIWFFAIWRAHEARRDHMPPDGRDEKTSSDPSVL